MKIEKVIRRVSADGRSVLNAAVAANVGESGTARASSVQSVEISQHDGQTTVRKHSTDKEI